ncbi:hypothetical protein THAOC_10698, partial [Thalassiosira oceanica]
GRGDPPPPPSEGGRKRPRQGEDGTAPSWGVNGVNRNRYAGWTVPSPGHVIPSVPVGDVDPPSFYERYVRTRRPVVLRGVPPELLRGACARWPDFAHLASRAGDETVNVERRSSTSDRFGRGEEVPMRFDEFLRLMAAEDGSGDGTRHYLTTQTCLADDDGRPGLLSPLMERLRDDFPLRPDIMGNLVPQNANLWMGRVSASSSSSSGLHHDYHDNLYVLMRGRKRFRLYSPADAGRLYTRGKLAKVHPNGRINYEGEETTAYGADVGSDAAARASRRQEEAERKLEEAERAAEEGEEGAQERLERAEEELERAMEAVLDAEMDGDEEDGDGVPAKGELFDEPRRIVDRTVKDPDNFSTVPWDILDDAAELKKSHPLVLEANAAFCELGRGDMLYLPASWFHEVTSRGEDVGGGKGDGGVHLALNYWFHPPDGESFERPYSTDFWPRDYEERNRRSAAAENGDA